MKKQKIKAIDSSTARDFEQRVNRWLNEGYIVSSTHCTAAAFTSPKTGDVVIQTFQAILILEEKDI